jgi:hypothetical protein
MDGTLTDDSAPAAARSHAAVTVDASLDLPAADPGAAPGTETGTDTGSTRPPASAPVAAGHSATSVLDQYLGIDAAPPASMLADLDLPDLVLTDGYVGPERRGSGRLDRLKRATFGQRRSMLQLEVMIVAVVVILAAASVTMLAAAGRHTTTGALTARHSNAAPRPSALAPAPAVATGQVGSSTTTPATPAAATPPAVTTPTTAPSSTLPVATVPPAPSAPPAVVPAAAPPAPAAAVPSAALTPAQMGAQALALVRYPWQRIPGYTLQFLPISQAPSPGFYGNTTFTWGKSGGTSVMYVYPGETVERLAAITAFEIGHEVDAAAVQPQGGETQIENILGMHPASWAPNCDCAEQGFLSGWYAAAFSDYWSPGVGNWSTIAPEPAGPVLTAVQPWLNPVIS